MKKAAIKFLSKLNQVPFSQADLSTMKKSAEEFSVIDWNYLFELIEVNAVQVLSYKRLTDNDLFAKLPPSLENQKGNLSLTVQAILKINEKRNKWTKKIIEQFHQEGIKLILLKGAYLGKEIYLDDAYKKMNDVDLLIDKKDIEKGELILRNLGFNSVGDFFSTLKYHKDQTHHTPPFIEKNGECVTGLHWNLISPFASIKINAEDLLKRAKLNKDGKSWGLSAEDNLFHLCVHLPYYKTGLRELADVSNLINNTQIDWDLFFKLTQSTKAFSRVYRVLILAQKMINFEMPLQIIEAIKNSAESSFIRETQLLLDNPERLYTSRSTYSGKIEKYFIVFKISTLWLEKFVSYTMMWWTLLFIPKKELKKMMSNRISGTVKLWRALGLDHGENALIIVTAGNFLELIKFTLKYIFSAKGKSLKNHPQYYLLKTLE